VEAAPTEVTEVATEVPAAETPATDPWARVQETGKLVVGTSADYPPFESYDETFQIVGFDPALINAIGQLLGVEVELHDIAFDGLGSALMVGQIDVAIAAISITPERSDQVDFSPIYFVSQDGVLAAEGSTVGEIKTLEDLVGLRVGVQRGSIYADMVKDNLVDTGLMPEQDLLLYNSTNQAVNDLQLDRIDVVMLDLLVAKDFEAEGDVALVGEGINREQYAIAYAKGATELQANINGALKELQDAGSVGDIAEEFLGIRPGPVVPLPTPTPNPQATPIPPTPGCINSMQWVSDLSYDDQNMTAPPVLQPGESFRKGWRVLNNGTCTWDSTYFASYVQGNRPGAQMSGQPTAVQGTVPPGATYDLYVDLIAPQQPGVWQGVWQMHNAQGSGFGARLWVGITVAYGPTPTPFVTQTPSPDINFTVDRTNINSGECVNFNWNVNNVNEVYFYQDGQNWEGNGVAGQGSRRECPTQTTTYNLRVVKRDGTVETRQIRIDVTQVANAPQINRFSIDPSGQIPVNQCVTLSWDVSGNVNTVNISLNGNNIWDNAPVRGNVQNCPSGPGGYDYGIEAIGPGGTSRANQHVQVVDSQPATATPTAPPTTEPTTEPTTVPTSEPPTPVPTDAPQQPVINSFSANPAQINPGDCVSLAWSTSGVANTRLSRNGNVLLDSGPVDTSDYQDCPTEGGALTYTLDAVNSAGQSTQASASVQVADVQPTPEPTVAPTAEAPPVISVFTVTPDQISAGQCVDITWQFSGTSLVLAQITRNGDVLPSLGDLTDQGAAQDCDTNTPGTYTYILKVDAEFSGSTTAQQVVTVQ